MDILRNIQMYAAQYPDRIAVVCGEDSLTYRELWEQSEKLAGWLRKQLQEDHSPIAVYGHKHPLMLAGFLGCVKSGHAYCPIDCSMPDARTEMILSALPSKLVLQTEELHADPGDKRVADLRTLIRNIEQADQGTRSGAPHAKPADLSSHWVSGEATYYIIFTSGSTGTPKGVQISADCLNHYLDWSVGLGSTQAQKQGQIFLNQAPFSFDLSVMDLYTCMACGGTLYCLEKSAQGDYRALMSHLKKSSANVWVSTPSFADVCLAEKSFCRELMPKLQVFLFCGETLTPRTADRLLERFPEAKVINTYGPTESTVAITDVEITKELATGAEVLPVGRAKPGTWLEIRGEEQKVLPDGEKGEIVIWGNTVSTGYYRRPDLTEKAFLADEEGNRGYRTGDKGYLTDGMLYYCGRIDFQIKLHGYRIELEDIENNIRRLPGVEHAAVVPNMRGGKIVSLSACICKNDTLSEQDCEELRMIPADRQETAKLKEALSEYLPEYMIPKKFCFINRMPMTNNGKADRKYLGGLKP